MGSWRSAQRAAPKEPAELPTARAAVAAWVAAAARRAWAQAARFAGWAVAGRARGRAEAAPARLWAVPTGPASDRPGAGPRPAGLRSDDAAARTCAPAARMAGVGADGSWASAAADRPARLAGAAEPALTASPGSGSARRRGCCSPAAEGADAWNHRRRPRSQPSSRGSYGASALPPNRSDGGATFGTRGVRRRSSRPRLRA